PSFTSCAGADETVSSSAAQMTRAARDPCLVPRASILAIPCALISVLPSSFLIPPPSSLVFEPHRRAPVLAAGKHRFQAHRKQRNSDTEHDERDRTRDEYRVIAGAHRQ